MRTLALFFPIAALTACTGEEEPKPEPVEDTAETAEPTETGDTAPIETGDSAPTETAETAETAEPIIDNDLDGSPVEEDCNDADPLVYPGAVDAICDNVDADCDGIGADDAFLIGETRYADLAAALGGAVSGDAIDVCPGIWVGNVTISAPDSLTIRSASGSPEDTSLDGGSVGPVLVVSAGIDLTLENIGISNGLATWRNDAYRQSGGGIYAEDAILTLRGAHFTNNTAQDDGAGVAFVVTTDTATLKVEASTFTDNRASDHGGAVAVLGAGAGDIRFTDSLFEENRAPAKGGALYFEGAPLSATVEGSTFDTNDASGSRSYGGAIGAEGSDVTLSVYDSTFSANTAGNSAGAVSMVADRSTLTVDSSFFSANTATQGGGAMRLTSNELSVAVNSCVFDANLASTQGGAVQIDGGGSVRLDTASVTGNSGGNAGGGLYLDEADGYTLTVDIAGGTFTTNRAGIGGGGGVYATGARVTATLVDFGASTSTNTPEDVYNCADDFSSSASFTYDESTGTFCR